MARGWSETENEEEWEDFEEDSLRFKEARDGDVWMTPFQCDSCHFVNIMGREALSDVAEDRRVLAIIRRANLDAFWSRERTTVHANWLEVRRADSILSELGIHEPFGAHQRGPHPPRDTFGMVAAIAFLQRSLGRGRNAVHIQFDTVRKLRTVYSNFHTTTPQRVEETARGNPHPGSGAPTDSPFFRRFLQGAHKRMGDLWIPDRALTIEQLLAAQDLLEEEWSGLHQTDPSDKRHKLAATGCLLTIGFSAALRGEELLKLDIGEVLRRWKGATTHPSHPHCPVSLRGRFKGETGEKTHAMVLAKVSASGIETGRWMERFISLAVERKVTGGPLFRKVSAKGVPGKARVADLDVLFHSVLKQVQRAHPGLIEPEVEVTEAFSVGRSLRRGATSQARNQKVPEDVITANNRWRNQEKAQARANKGSLLETYTDVLANLPLRLQFSQSL